MEDEKLDLHPKKAGLNVRWKKNFKTYSKKGTRGRKAPKDLTKKAPLQTEASKKNFKTYQRKGTRGQKAPNDLTKKAPLQTEASKKNFKTYQRKGTRGQKAPNDLTKKAPLQIEASSTDSLLEMTLIKYGIMSREKINMLKEDMRRLEVKSVWRFADKAWEDHSNCRGKRAEEEEDSDSSEPSDDEWKPKWPSPAPMYPLCENGFPPFRFA